MHGWAITLILLSFAAPAIAVEMASSAVQAFEGKVRPRDWQQLAVDPAQPRRFVEITRVVELSCHTQRGELSERSLMLLKGVYPIERQFRHKRDGTDWLVVPAVSSRPVTFGYNNAKGRTWDYEHVVALNPNSLAIFPREIVGYTQEWSRLDGSRWNEKAWAFGCVPSVVDTAAHATMRFVTEEEFQAARDGQVRQGILEVLDDSIQRKRALDRERPLKSQIGTQVCRASGPLILQGFTEDRSPDNDKLRIRIWRASLSDQGRPSTVVPGDFRESVVWDDADNWSLCDH